MGIQLSISLLASSRIGSLERCLDSLRPILAKIPSELIIVFTGIDERVRELAERYTDCVIPFAWRDDFSAARNAGLAEAKGEWFLYIDDDEWFEDTAEICDFFLSGEYREYSSACYVVRNYLQWDGIRYSDYDALRMVRRTPDLRFHGRIHEELVIEHTRIKYFRALVHHYGYVKDINTAKTSRNIPLLHKTVENSPEDLKSYVQLAREYFINEEWEKAEEYCRKVRELSRGGNASSPFVRWAQAYLPRILSRKPNPLPAIKEAEKILRKERTCELSRLLLFQLLAELYAKFHNSEKAVEYGVRSEDLLEEIDASLGLWKEQGFGDLSEAAAKDPIKALSRRAAVAACALECGNREAAERLLALLPWQDAVIEGYCSLFDRLRERHGLDLWGLLPEIRQTSSYLMAIRAEALLEEGTEEARAEAEDIFTQCAALGWGKHMGSRLIRLGILHGLDLSPLLDGKGLEEWKACASEALKGIPYAQMPRVLEAQEGIQERYPLQGLFLKRLLLEKRLYREYLSGEALYRELSFYCDCILEFYRAQYREELFEGGAAGINKSVLPQDCRFALVASEALRLLEEEKGAESVGLFREAIGLYPAMTGVLREVLRQAVAVPANIPAAHAGEEFAQLAVQMKEAVHGMIGNRKYAEALSVIEQLLPLLPDDLEVLKMRQQALRQGIAVGKED